MFTPVFCSPRNMLTFGLDPYRHDHDPVLSELRLFWCVSLSSSSSRSQHRLITEVLDSVDEVHSVGADVRGAVLEVVVSRMKTLGTSTRFVAVSATVPNIKDVSEWLSESSRSESIG